MSDDLIYIDRGAYREAVPRAQIVNAHVLPEAKALELPVTTTWEAGRALWPEFTWSRLKTEGFYVNAAFSACVTAYALALPEPPLVVTDASGDPVKQTHPLQKLLTRPNPWMSHNELISIVATYLLVGGNAYLHKVRNGASSGSQTVELYPYSDGHMTPIPGQTRWIEAYEYNNGDGKPVRIPWSDVVHLKWPVPDLDYPWRALSPLRLLAREVDADTEMTRIVWSLLRNDATPRTLIVYPAGVTLTKEERDAIKARFGLAHGGDHRGGVGVATGGADVRRLALNLQELDLSALRHIPESRITAVCSIPAMLVGLNVGLERSTYSNMEEARKGWTTGTLSRLWALMAGELEADLSPEFGADLVVAFDTSKVAALQPNMTQLRADAALLYEKQIATRNEARAMVFLPPEGEIDVSDGGDTFFDGSIPSTERPEEPEPAPPRPAFIDVTPPPAALPAPDEEEAETAAVKARRAAAFKAIRKMSMQRTERAFAQELVAYLERQRAAAVEER